MKKIASIVLALILVLAMAAPAMAEGATGYTITIEPAAKGHTYEAYQIFTGRLEGDVLSDIVWGKGVNGNALLAALKGSENEAFVEGGANIFTECKNAADVANVLSGKQDDSAIAQAFADIVGRNLTLTPSGTVSATENGYKITGLVAGYYLVKDKDGSVAGTEHDFYTRYILEVVKNVTVNPKGAVPTVDKAIVENGEDIEAADYDIGDSVSFKLTGTLPENYADYEIYKYVFHDTLSSGLTYNGDARVYVVNRDEETELTTGFTVSPDAAQTTGGDILTITFENLKDIDGVNEDSKIVVKYTATLNSAADIGQPGNDNKVKLEYSNNPNDMGDGTPTTGETPEDVVIVFTYELDVTKQDADANEDNSHTALKDAEFVLMDAEQAKVAKVTDGKFDSWVADAAAKNEDDTYKAEFIVKSGNDGKFAIAGLDEGTYYLKEIKAPVGYNLLGEPIKIKIDATLDTSENNPALTALTIDVDDKGAVAGEVATGIVSTTVYNNKGATLPSTGGMGTTIFYIVGGLLIAGAAIALITKKRMASK